MAEPSAAELMAVVIARDLLRGCRHVAVGAASPIPAAGALLARELAPGALQVSLLGSARHNPFTDGGRELFDCAAQGRIDAFFLGGVQIDGEGNVNLLGTGPYPRLERRFAGNFGSAYLAFLVPRLILFREEHTPRTLVERVDFVSAPGRSPEGVYRPGGPSALLTGRCLFEFKDGRFVLTRTMPRHEVDEIRRQTGFAFEVSPAFRPVDPPDQTTLRLLRGPVREALAEAYPKAAAVPAS